jgi:hypothetical protein
MAKNVTDLLSRVCEMIAKRIDFGRIADAKRRQADMFAWRTSDCIPILLGKPVAEAHGLPGFDLVERWHDPAKSLYVQLKDEVLPRLEGGGDAVPAVRPNTGVINCMTVFGCAYEVPAYTMPVISKYASKESLARFEAPEDVSRLGVMPKMIEHAEHHRAVLREHGLWDAVRLVHCDQQGPWDIAAQVRGHDIFLDVYEDPPFVHDLMKKCTKVYVAVSRLCKTFDPSPIGGAAGAAFWMDNGTVRMCGDSDILISAAQHREFVAPYQAQAFLAMGGGWMHYCGGMPGFRRREGLHLHDIYAGIGGLRGLNWTTAGDWMAEMRRLRDLRVCNVGGLPRRDGESPADYFRRALEPYPARTGFIFEGPSLAPDEVGGAVDLWRRVQDEKYR